MINMRKFELLVVTYSNCQLTFIFYLIFQKSTLRLVEDESIAALETDAPDHPSPVSVLDVSVYKDDMPSPVKLMSSAPKGIVSVFRMRIK